jgi:uncharacterized membrane protein YecN with MAPEG domain
MDEKFAQKQSHVLHACGSMAIVCGTCFALAYYIQPAIFISSDRGKQCKWFVLIAVNYFVTIFSVVLYRTKSDKAIDGSAYGVESKELAVLRAILQNTTEQTILIILSHIVWIFAMPEKFLCIQPVSAILFIIGRILFARGYQNSTKGRANGFALTLFSSAVLLIMEMIWFIYELF